MTTRSQCYADAFKAYVQAGQKKDSPDELRKCSISSIDKVRLRAAENPCTPVECLEQLATDCNPDVRIAVALNSATPIAVKAVIANDSDPTVRYGIAEDPLTEVEILQLLADDCNPYVSCRARKTLECLDAAKRKNEKGGEKFKISDCIKRPRRIFVSSVQSFVSSLRTRRA